MASRYDSWVPTAPVHLPIDTYKIAALLNEQKTQQAVDEVQQTMATYNSIVPFSANPQALYDETMEDLRSRVMDVTKMNLNTPEAKRKVNQIIGDPTIVRNLKNVMTDALYATQRQKEEQEYLKKNPDINTLPYRKVFDAAQREMGDPTQFNPSRFKNISPLIDYVDFPKILNERVEKLKMDKEKIREIVGFYYHDTEYNALAEAKIRRHVASQIAMDPMVSGQIKRNIEYAIYRQNPQDRNAAVKSLANSYRGKFNGRMEENIASYQQMENERVKQLTAGIKKGTNIKEILAADPLLTRIRKTLAEAIKQRGAYTDPTHPGYLEDEDQVNTGYEDAIVNGFSEHAFKETTDMWSFNPAFEADQAWRRLKYRLDKEEAMIRPINAMPLTYPLPLSQGTPGTGTMKDIMGSIPGMEDLAPYVTQNGAIDFEHPDRFIRKEKEAPNFAGRGNTVKELFTPSWFKDPETGAYGPNYSMNQALSPKEAKENATKKLTEFLRAYGRSPEDYNYFATEMDFRRAYQDVTNFFAGTQRTNMTTSSTTQSNTDAARAIWIQNASSHGVLDNQGQAVSKEKAEELAAYVQKIKPSITTTPAIRGVNTNQSYLTITMPGGEAYHAGLDPGNSMMLTGARENTKYALGDKRGYLAQPDSSASIIEMGPNGSYYGLNIPKANTEYYQAVAKQYWDHNEKKLTDLGISKGQAKDILNSRYGEIQAQLEANVKNKTPNKPAYLKVTVKGKEHYVPVLIPVKKRDDLYYSQYELYDGQMAERGVMDLDSYNKGVIHNYSSIENNPWIYQMSQDQLRKETEEATAIQNRFRMKQDE